MCNRYSFICNNNRGQKLDGGSEKTWLVSLRNYAWPSGSKPSLTPGEWMVRYNHFVYIYITFPESLQTPPVWGVYLCKFIFIFVLFFYAASSVGNSTTGESAVRSRCRLTVVDCTSTDCLALPCTLSCTNLATSTAISRSLGRSDKP